MSVLENDQEKPEDNLMAFGGDNSEQKLLKDSITNFSQIFGSYVTQEKPAVGSGSIYNNLQMNTI